MKTLNTILLISLFALSPLLKAQTTYYTGFDTDAEKANWTQFTKGKTGNARWEIIAGGIDGSKRVTHYAPTGDANKDSLVNWYVSPKFDFSEGGAIDSLKFNYFSFMNTFIAEQRVHIYLLVGSKDPSTSSSKTLLADLTSIYSGDDKQWKDTGDLIIPNTAVDCYIAFKFVAIDGWSSISYDNIYITSNKVTSLRDEVKEKNSSYVYPNPSTGNIKLNTNRTGTTAPNVKVYSSLGTKVWEGAIPNEGIELNLPSGHYSYTVSKGMEILGIHKLTNLQ